MEPLSSRIRLAVVPVRMKRNNRRPDRAIPRIPKSRRFDVARDEFNHVIDLLNERGEILPKNTE
jgi:hypothetical protein